MINDQTLKLTLLQAGRTTAPGAMILRGESWRKMTIPALFALLEHPRLGPILFDTGYSPRFLLETRRWPYWLYAKITPVFIRAEETAVAQLQRRGIRPADIERVIVSHFHVDHIGGLADFPRAQFIFYPDAFQPKSGLAAVKAGFLPGHIPADFAGCAAPIDPAHTIDLPPETAPFARGVDLLGDGSLLAVRLPGHAVGQMGLFLQAEGLGPVFLCADACWHSRAFRELIFPHPLLNHLLHPDPAAYHQSIRRIHQLHQRRPELHIIPSHCPEAAARYGARP